MVKQKNAYWIVVIAALGYFVDIYDLILFNVVKETSLAAIGITGELYKTYEITLFNWQMFGMLIGGLLWGILGDKKGRVSVLFGSIIMYSLANIANGMVSNINQYVVCRFIAGIGLAGELGAGITLVSETMHKDKRGIGTMIIVSFGALGAVFAAIVGKYLSWNSAYFLGGGLGLALLALRAGAFESGMYSQIKTNKTILRGNFFMLFHTKERAFLYLKSIAIGVPIWFMIGVLINLSPRFITVEGIDTKTMLGAAVMFTYIGLSIGDVFSGLLSQLLKSRKKVIYLYLFLSMGLIIYYLNTPTQNFTQFRISCLLLGIGTGYWALFVQVASENFGTNIRSTVTNTVPNFVRFSVVPISLSFKSLSQHMTVQSAAFIVGGICLAIALISLYLMKETFSKDLNYHEEDVVEG
jgi:MFS transporter, putative metabolite:H+ symporter